MKNIEQNEKFVKDLLSKSRELEVNPPSYIRTKIISSLEENKSKNLWAWFFGGNRHFIFASFCAVLLLTVTLFPFKQGSVASSYFVNKDYVMNVSIEELNLTKVSYIEVIPSQGLSFVSKKFPEISKLESLKLLGKSVEGMNKIPIAFSANSKGVKKFQIKFYDQNLDIIYERDVHFEVKNG